MTPGLAADPKRIFFSYGHDENRPIVERFKRDLEQRGHQVWIDYDRIGSWDDWRGRITEGLNDSEMAVAFLSIHSVRNPGVCRNEIAMALQKFGRVYPLLLEKLDSTADIPITLGHLQWPDLSDWRSVNGNDIESESFNQYYQSRLNEVIAKIEGDASRFNREISYLEKILRPVSFEGRFRQHIDGFTGREWLFGEFRSWLEIQPASRLFWLSAGPGFGKTAWAVNVAARNPETVVGLWMCEQGSLVASDTRRALSTLAFQLAQRLDDYRSLLLERIYKELGTDSEMHKDEEGGDEETGAEQDEGDGDAGASEGDPSGQAESSKGNQEELASDPLKLASLLASKNDQDLFTLLFTEPMSGMIPRYHKHVIVIDALDEVSRADGQNPLAELIDTFLMALPSWLCAVVTSRPDPAVMDRLGRFQPLEIKPTDERNRVDLTGYCRQVINGFGIAEAMDEASKEKMVSELVFKSGGMILYLQRIAEGMAQGVVKPADLSSLDTGITGLESFYLRDFRHRFSEGFDNQIRPLLRLMLAAPGELSEKFAATLLGDPEDVRRSRIRIASYLGGPERGLQFAHKTVSDWITGDRSSVFYTDREKGRKQIGTYLWKCFEERDQDSEYGTVTMTCEKEVLTWLPDLFPLLQQWRNAKDLRQFGEFLNSRKAYRASVPISGRSYRIRKREKGLDHLYTLRAGRVYGRALQGSGDLSKAIDVFGDVLKRRAAHPKLGKTHRLTLVSMNDYASALNEFGRIPEALEIYREQYSICEKEFGYGDSRTLRTGNRVAVLLRSLGKDAEARDFILGMLPEMEARLAMDEPRILAMKSLLGNIEERLENLDASEKLYREVLAIREAKDPAASTTILSLCRLGSCLLRKKLYGDALEYLWKAWKLRGGIKSPDDTEGLNLLLNLTLGLNRSGSRSDAVRVLEENISFLEGSSIPLLYNLACYECLEGKTEQAKQHLSHFINRNPQWKDKALEDSDLANIHEWILTQ
jgi:tetratricopeptide (TPR) repeat protein